MVRTIWCLMLLSCLTLTCLGQGDDADGDGDVIVTKEETEKNGRKVSVTRLAARDCSYVATKSLFDDDSYSYVVDELQDEVRVIVLSTVPDTCFVHDIIGARARCDEGSYTVPQVLGQHHKHKTVL